MLLLLLAMSGPPTAEAGSGGPGLNQVVIGSCFFDFEFSNTATVREPTKAEVDGVIEATNNFFTNVLTAEHGVNFTSFTADNAVAVRLAL